jgi:hypothetical protein
LLNVHCVACHGGVKQAGDISFVYRDQAMTMIEAGSPDDSTLFQRVTSENDDERMPPAEHGRRLNDEEVSILRRWIEQGAKWTDHWAFVAPLRQTAPTSDTASWSKQPIDPFVYDKLASLNLQPNEESKPDRWLRRVSIDLIGLPPREQDRNQFLFELKIDKERAYAAAVDRLLNAPQFGERWASVWLDAVRYADSRGLGQDGRRTVWKYRDWIIKAFNADMPYDQFTIRQIAGDLLPKATLDDLVATGCHRMTQTNEEGGTDDEQFRVEAVLDRVNTTWQIWQGLTIGCVQCHSHPYDPIRHEEYYQSVAFFNNTMDSDLTDDVPNIKVPIDDANNERVYSLIKSLNDTKRADWVSVAQNAALPDRWQSVHDLSLQSNNTTKVEVATVDGVQEYKTVGNVARNTTITLNAALPADCKQITALQFTGLPEDEAKARLFSEQGFVISHLSAKLVVPNQPPVELAFVSVIADEPDSYYDPNESLNPKTPGGFGGFSKIFYPRSAAFILAEPVSVPDGARIEVSISQNLFDLDSFPMVAHRGRIAISNHKGFTQWWNSPEHAQRRDKIAECEKSLAAIPTVVSPVMKEREARFSRITTRFDRGDFLSKAEPVQADTPDFLPAIDASATPTRLDFAKWLASRQNPLTARVAVNRVWAQLFGAGLVETQEDFGSSGDTPSHPELLDDLAVRFMDDMAWSTKKLLREIVLSSTYRQNSQVTAEKLEIDPNNRWLSRGPRVRLPAETVRDQALAISGLLSDRMYGPPVYPPLPEGVWTPFQTGEKWPTPTRGDPNRYRRTVYTYTKRSIPFPIMASFDAPTREFCSSRRLRSNTPIQSLMTLNDEAFVEAIDALAHRMITSGKTAQTRIEHGFVLATSRHPELNELSELVALYDLGLQQAQTAAQSGLNPDELAQQKTEIETQSQLKAMQSVAAVLLNLDEIFTN